MMPVVTIKIPTSYQPANGDLELIRQLCLPYKIIGQNMKVDSLAIGMRINRLAERLGVENRTAIIVKAIKLGLIDVDELIYREYDGGKNLSGKIN